MAQKNDPNVIALQKALPADENLKKSFLASLEAIFPSLWGLLIVDDPAKKPNITLYRLDRLELRQTPKIDWSAYDLKKVIPAGLEKSAQDEFKKSFQTELENSVQTTTFYHRQSKKLINIHNVHLRYSDGKSDLAEAVVKALCTQYTNAQNIVLGDFNAWIPPTDFDFHHNGTNTTPLIAEDEYYCCDSFFTVIKGQIKQISGKVIDPEFGDIIERPPVLEVAAIASKPYTRPMFEGNHWLPLSIPRTFDEVTKAILSTLKKGGGLAEETNLSIHLQKNLYNNEAIKISANTNISLLDELGVSIVVCALPKNSKRKQVRQLTRIDYFLYPNELRGKRIIELLYWLNGLSIAQAITNAATNIKTLPHYNLFGNSLDNIAQLVREAPSNETAMILAATENLLKNCSEKNIRAYLEFALEVSGKPSRNAKILGASMLCLGVLVTAATIVFATLPVALVLPIVLGVVAFLACSVGAGSLYAGWQKGLSKEMNTVGTHLLSYLSFFAPKNNKLDDQPKNTFNSENTATGSVNNKH